MKYWVFGHEHVKEGHKYSGSRQKGLTVFEQFKIGRISIFVHIYILHKFNIIQRDFIIISIYKKNYYVFFNS